MERNTVSTKNEEVPKNWWIKDLKIRATLTC